MNKFIANIKNLVNGKKKDKPIKEAYAEMDKIINDAEKAYGEDFFPKEETLTSEQVHYLTLKLEEGASFEEITAQYEKLKAENNPQNFKDDEKQFNDAKGTLARIEFSYAYFKQKFSK